jgi:hypothetical protein
MDDFRVGSVPASDPYGHRQTAGSIARKKEKHRDDQHGEKQGDEADIFESFPSPEADAAGELIEDYYLPSDPSGDAE